MFWKSKSKDEEQKPMEVMQPTMPVTEQPFFNVMPRTKVTVVPPEQSATSFTRNVPTSVPKVDPVASRPTPTPPPTETVHMANPQEIRVVTPPPTPPVVTSSPEGVLPSGTVIPPTRRAVKIIALLASLALVGFAVWYAVGTLGSDMRGQGWKAAVQRVLPFLGSKTTTTTPPPAIPPVSSGEPEPAAVFETTPEWRAQNFIVADCDQSQCGDSEDPDQDGLVNLKEFQVGTSPVNIDSDSDGLVDGDEVEVFACSPLDAHTAGDATYTDADDLKGGWDCGRPAGSTDKMSEEKLEQIRVLAAAKPLHEATFKTLGDSAARYQAASAESSAVPESQPSDVPADLPSDFDAAPQALLERDLQRLGTIKKVGVALVKYQVDNKTYPDVPDFPALMLKLKPYITVATNAQDPVNKPPFVYLYNYLQDGADFDLRYYSETQKQVIRYTSSQAKKDAEAEGAVSRDGQRMQDLEKIRSALLIYSAATVQSSKSFNFPPAAQYKQKMVPQYMKALPTDPTTGKDYEYSASKDGATFTLRVPLENPAGGTSGYACNQDACQTY